MRGSYSHFSKRFGWATGVMAAATFLAPGESLRADEPAAPTETPAAAEPSDRTARRAKAFGEALTNVKLVGRFTAEGMTGEPREESYVIRSVKHVSGDMYMFEAVVYFGKSDTVIGLPLKVLYAGDTPVITLDDTTIPGMGTFDSRVMIHQGHYSGTWKHGSHGGLLYGKIEKLSEEELAKMDKSDDAK